MNRKERRAATKNGNATKPNLVDRVGEAAREHQAGRLKEADYLLRRILEIAPTHTDALFLRGIVLDDMRRPAEAAACFLRVLAAQPAHADAHNSLGISYRSLGRWEEAAASFSRAVALEPNFVEALANYGNALRELAHPEEAITYGMKAAQLAPLSPEIQCNTATSLRDLGRLDEAIRMFRHAAMLKPDHPIAHLNLGLALLARGDMLAGWSEYEWRWGCPWALDDRRHLERPLWTGEAGHGQVLLIYSEQGFGDTIQFCRYAPLAAARGFRVILEVQPPLARLMRSLPGVEQVIARGDCLPDFDLRLPMLSLPRVFKTTLDSIPSVSPAYLHTEAAMIAQWKNRLEAMGGAAKRVGLVWAGQSRPHDPTLALIDKRRSVAPDLLAPLFEVPGLHFFSLQKDGPRMPPALPLTDLMSEMSDFADTAALIANLDLVISVDTAVLHLAAALGKPAWLLDRFDSCWRWLTGRADSPWYPTVRIFRQKQPRDWQGAIAELRDCLQQDPR
jgi:tetratricopeptide (TPR) repeat protein